MGNPESAGGEERGMGPDVDSALATTQDCAKCNSEITGGILMSNYAYEEMFSINYFDGCEPVVLCDIEKLFLDFLKTKSKNGKCGTDRSHAETLITRKGRTLSRHIAST